MQRISSFLRILGAVAASTALSLAGCSPRLDGQTTSPETSASPASPVAASPAVDRPNVVATAIILCDITKQVAGDTVDLTCLVPAGTDPHVYSPSPSDRRALEDAELILYSGYDYEPDLIQMVRATNTTAPKVTVFEKAVPNPLMSEPHDHDHAHEEEAHAHEEEKADAHGHDHGHDHGGEKAEAFAPDPHVWHNPEHGVRMVEIVRQQLEQLSPENAALYSQNAIALTQDLQTIQAWIPTQIATVPENARKLVTPHDSFRYFAEAFGFTVKGTIEGLSTDERPSAARMAELVDLVKEANVPAIFSEQTTNPQLIETVARNANVKVADQPLYVEGPGGADSTAQTYQQMLVENTCTIVNTLGGTCDRAGVADVTQ